MILKSLGLAAVAALGWFYNSVPIERSLPLVPAGLEIMPTTLSASIPVFPGAEGWGADALDDCSALPVQVLFVTDVGLVVCPFVLEPPI